MSNLAQRVLVALVAIPLIVLVGMLGGWPFYGLIMLVAVLGLREFYLLMSAKGAYPQPVTGHVLGVIVVTTFFWNKFRLLLELAAEPLGFGHVALSDEQVFLACLLAGVPVVLVVELYRRRVSAVLNAATTLFGVMYVSLFLGSLVGLRELFTAEQVRTNAFLSTLSPDDVNWLGGITVVTVFVSLWVCDTFAYFAGRFFGKHKLFERVSPNKTWEGAIAGYVGGVAVFLFSQNFFLGYMTVGSAFVCGSIIGVFGQVGDLAESLLKRDAGVKDSSALIPGHGGVLDRFDSLMFVSPLLFLYMTCVVL